MFRSPPMMLQLLKRSVDCLADNTLVDLRLSFFYRLPLMLRRSKALLGDLLGFLGNLWLLLFPLVSLLFCPIFSAPVLPRLLNKWLLLFFWFLLTFLLHLVFLWHLLRMLFYGIPLLRLLDDFLLVQSILTLAIWLVII